MVRRTKVESLGAAVLFSLVLQQSCTDNPATRVLPSPYSKGSGGSTAGSGARPTGGTAGIGGSGPGTGGSSAGDAGAGGADGDPCLSQCADPTACTAEEQLLVDFCKLYAKRCPDQPADVMMELGPGTPI